VTSSSEKRCVCHCHTKMSQLVTLKSTPQDFRYLVNSRLQTQIRFGTTLRVQDLFFSSTGGPLPFQGPMDELI
jgi:hypothetical protein